jgi:beta-xylosidase
MTALLPARALTRPGGARSTPIRRRVAQLGVATVAVVVAGLAWPARADLAFEDRAGDGVRPTIAPSRAVDPTPQTELVDDRPPRTVPRPLAPASPPDGRDAPDPFILADAGRYLLYSTQVGFHNVPVATSPDLRQWSPATDALPQLPAWAAWGRTWAPGVVRLGGGYVLYFAAHHRPSGRQCIGVAASATPAGPFVPAGTVPLVCQTELGGSIDPHPFIDADGTPYLLWKADGNAIGRSSTLFAQGLTPDGLGLIGQPAALLSSDASWEQPLIENPALVAAGRSYVLLYSGGWWESAGYAAGYATCDTPLGPCTKATVDGPLLASGGDQAGPGGVCMVEGPAGDQWLAYLAWSPGAVGYASGGTRSLRFAAWAWRDGQPVISH